MKTFMKAKTHQVDLIERSKNFWRYNIISGHSKNVYTVSIKKMSNGHMKAICNCPYGKVNGCGCSHTIAAYSHLVSLYGRQAVPRSPQNDLKHFKRKVVELYGYSNQTPQLAFTLRLT